MTITHLTARAKAILDQSAHLDAIEVKALVVGLLTAFALSNGGAAALALLEEAQRRARP